MGLLLNLGLAIVIALATGLASAWFALDSDRWSRAVALGPWTVSAAPGASDADPYARARLARVGEIPLGGGEGILFIADRDDAGIPLAGRCIYSVSGRTPPARLWTLSAHDAAGRPIADVTGRIGLHSREIVWRQDGSFAVVVSGEAQPGNWLPIRPAAGFRLLLRLYDTPLTGAVGIEGQVMPSIVATACA